MRCARHALVLSIAGKSDRRPLAPTGTPPKCPRRHRPAEKPV